VLEESSVLEEGCGVVLCIVVTMSWVIEAVYCFNEFSETKCPPVSTVDRALPYRLITGYSSRVELKGIFFLWLPTIPQMVSEYPLGFCAFAF